MAPCRYSGRGRRHVQPTKETSVRPRLPVLTALLAGIALAVTACSDDGGGGQEPESTGAGEELPAVEGGYGDEPTITFPESGAPAELQSEVLQEGDGTEVGADDFVVADYHGQIGRASCRA